MNSLEVRDAIRLRTRGRGSGPSCFDLGRATDGGPLLLRESLQPTAATGGPSLDESDRRRRTFATLLRDTLDGETGIVGVLNGVPHHGSGHVAAGLALVGSSLGRTVALVGANIEPVHGLAAEEVTAGLYAATERDKPLSELLLKLRAETGTLHYLPPGPLDGLGDPQRLASILDELRVDHDLVVVELPAFTGALHGDVDAVAALGLDHALVCSTGRSGRTPAMTAVDRLADHIPASRVHLTRMQPRPIFVREPLAFGEPAAIPSDAGPEGSPAVDRSAVDPHDVDLVDGVIDLRERGTIDDLVTVVIPCRNEEDFIDDVLESVQAQTHRRLEIIVVDGDSTDRTIERVRRRARNDPRIRLVANPDGIVSPGLNRVLEQAAGRWLVRIDAHCTVPADYVARVVSHLSTGRWGGVGGTKIGVGRTRAGRAIAAAMTSPVGVGNSVYHHGEHVQEVDHIPFGAYPVGLARAVGGWDVEVITNQDFEFDQRVRGAGQPLLFDPAIVIRWHCRQSLPELFAQYRRYGRGKSVVARMHPSSIRPRHLIPPIFVLAGTILALPWSAVSLRLGGLVRVARLVSAATYGSVLAWGSSRVSSTDPERPLTAGERVLVGGAFVAMHVGQGLGFLAGLASTRVRR